MAWGWLSVPLILAVADWLAVGMERRRVRWFAKPAALAALIFLFTFSGGWQNGAHWFGLGLLASMAGDVFLLFPRSLFMAGLVSFLLAHIAYMIGFQPLTANNLPVGVLVAAAVGFTGAVIFNPILSGLKRTGRIRLCLPFRIYAAALSLMFISALMILIRPDWPPLARVLAAGGAALFYLSDSTLAVHRFARRLPHGDLAIMITYHLGQIALICGVLIRYSN